LTLQTKTFLKNTNPNSKLNTIKQTKGQRLSNQTTPSPQKLWLSSLVLSSKSH